MTEPAGIESPGDVLALLARAHEDPAERAVLAEVLRDTHPIHQGRSASDVLRLRAFVMQAFGELGLPDAALPYVLEELETSQHSEALVAAARALRGANASRDYVPILERAAKTARDRDEYVSFTSYDAVGDSRTGITASDEIALTLEWIAEQAEAAPSGCCGPAPQVASGIRRIAPADRSAPDAVADLALEDQDGARITFAELFAGRPSIVTFFYTRCENPTKCSLTVSKLARVQQLLERRGIAADVSVAAMSYDPAFDSRARLRAYGVARGFKMSDKHRILRSPAGLEQLSSYFGCGVSRVGSTVSRHRVELYVLDAQGRVAVAFEHRAWDPEQVVREVANLREGGRGKLAVASNLLTTLPAIALALLPKCPLCWAGYASAFGIAGLEAFGVWSKPVLGALVLASAGSSWLRARRTRWYLPFALVALGAFAIIAGGLGSGLRAAIGFGAAAIVAGVALSAFGQRFFARSSRLRVVRASGWSWWYAYGAPRELTRADPAPGRVARYPARCASVRGPYSQG